jgi:hypothetical protein
MMPDMVVAASPGNGIRLPLYTQGWAVAAEVKPS